MQRVCDSQFCKKKNRGKKKKRSLITSIQLFLSIISMQSLFLSLSHTLSLSVCLQNKFLVYNSKYPNPIQKYLPISFFVRLRAPVSLYWCATTFIECLHTNIDRLQARSENQKKNSVSQSSRQFEYVKHGYLLTHTVFARIRYILSVFMNFQIFIFCFSVFVVNFFSPVNLFRIIFE